MTTTPRRPKPAGPPPPALPNGVTIRPYVPSDLPALYDVCLRTGDSGRDASALYEDPFLLGHIYAGPYPTHDPALSFVATDERGVVGYTVATADTAAFEHWRNTEWYPPIRNTYPSPDTLGPKDRDLLHEIYGDEVTDDAELLRAYPAHLHIDLLPRAQRRGVGRALTETLWAALRERGVPGVHLGVGAGNTDGLAFYARLGYAEYRAEPWGFTLVKDLRG